MGKIILSIVLWLLSTGVCFADGFELTDEIKKARDIQLRQAVKDSVEEPIKEVKNQQTPSNETKEKTAEEKINPEEIINGK